MKLKRWDYLGVFVVAVIGTLMHFTYEWSGGHFFVGMVAAVNESTFEHMKLLFWPMLLFTIIEYFIVGKDYAGFIPARVMGIIAGTILIPIIFYTYTGIIGTHFLSVDIIIFIISVLAAFLLSYKLTIKNRYTTRVSVTVALVGIIVITFCFIWFTLYPPHLKIFLDPVTSTYGIFKLGCVMAF